MRFIANRCCILCAKIAVAKYQVSEKGKETIAKYDKSDARKMAMKKYNQSEKAKIVERRYFGTEKQKQTYRRAQSTVKSKLARALRNRIRQVIKRGRGLRAGSAVRDLGCSIEQFKVHITAQFSEGMHWDNYGEWHLDHIRPLAIFDLSDRTQFLAAVHYTNYQPLWALDNWRKAAKRLEAA